MFDLIVLAQSALVCRRGEQQRTNHGATQVLIWPLLSLYDLNTLNSSTNFYQVEWVAFVLIVNKFGANDQCDIDFYSFPNEGCVEMIECQSYCELA